MAGENSSSARTFIVLGVIILFGIITFALAAATLATLNKRLGVIEDKLNLGISPPPATTIDTTQQPVTTTSTTQPPVNSSLVGSINIVEILQYLTALNDIGNQSNGNRAIGQIGFNRTLDYITQVLTNETNFNITNTLFSVRDFGLVSVPIFISTINNNITNYTYSVNESVGDFLHTRYSVSSNGTIPYQLTVIPNGGCTEDDWKAASAPTFGRVGLVKRGGSCTFAERAAQGFKANISGILFYNDGTQSDRFSPIEVGIGQENVLPGLFLSYSAGEALAHAVLNTTANVTVQIGIEVQNLPNIPVSNICADTPTGNISETIIIGSHSDSVPAGPGINDNGSGSAANLALAVTLARLFQTSTYAKYKYRVRFCWWGAEEVGLLGARDYVNKAKVATTAGERLTDHLINLNYDMLGSPNFMFGIYNHIATNNVTSPNAILGSNKTSDLFKQWFDQQRLPWDFTDLSGRSDYGPFLAEGIAVGGLFSGADGRKTQEQYDKYNKILGFGMGGIVNATYDSCYHKACDTIENINRFAYEKMIHAAGYVLEYLGRQDNLKAWLYP